VCPKCGTLYNAVSRPPKVEGICDLDGDTLVVREDDREEVVRERLDQYEAQTRPVIEYFRDSGARLFDVDASQRSPGSGFRADSGNAEEYGNRARDGRAVIVRKTRAELEKMRRSGLLVHNILKALGEMVHEGVSTWDLELAAIKMMEGCGSEAGVQELFCAGGG
jgi:Xaa-Pro aminopeptidase